MEKIKDYFKRYPLSNEVYECAGVLFHNRGAAESYGKGDVTKHTRESIEAAVLADSGDDEDDDVLKAARAEKAAQEAAEKAEAEKAAKEAAKKEAEEKAAAEKTAFVQTLKDTADLATIAYADRVKMVKGLELEAADQKAETLLAVLTAFKETLKAE